MRVALVYDRVNKWGGAERVLLALNELFPEASLYTSIYSPENAPWANVFLKVIPSFLNKYNVLRNSHEILSIFMPMAFESFNFDEYDLVISVTSEGAKGIITKPKTKHICYCLTPTRYLYTGFREYENNPPGKLGLIPFYKKLSVPFITYMKRWDQIAAQRPDRMIAISTEVRNRINKYYRRDSNIIFPPVDIEKFAINKPAMKSKKNRLNEDDYFLIVSRLEPYKKVDLAIQAFIKMNKKLVIIGTGSLLSKFKSKYKLNKNIVFKGFVSDDELSNYYQNAKAFVFPQEEDFGIAAVEAQAAGCPVIAYKKGGSLDTVMDRKTGLFFSDQNVESLISAVKIFEEIKFDKSILRKNAVKFGNDRFKKEILDLMKIND